LQFFNELGLVSLKVASQNMLCSGWSSSVFNITVSCEDYLSSFCAAWDS